MSNDFSKKKKKRYEIKSCSDFHTGRDISGSLFELYLIYVISLIRKIRYNFFF